MVYLFGAGVMTGTCPVILATVGWNTSAGVDVSCGTLALSFRTVSVLFSRSFAEDFDELFDRAFFTLELAEVILFAARICGLESVL